MESNGKTAILTFAYKIAEHAKKENKIVKIISDDYKVRKVLRSQLEGIPVEYGLKGELELELKK